MLDGGIGNAGLLGQLRNGTILVQPRHSEPAIGRNFWSVAHRDQAIRITRIAHHQDADIVRSCRLNRLTRVGKDRTIDADQVSTFHSLLTGNTADTNDKVTILEADVEMVAVSFDDTVQCRESTVIKLHVNAVEGRHHRRNFHKVQDNGLIRPEDFTRRQTKNHGVTNLAGRTGDRNANGGSHDLQHFPKKLVIRKDTSR